MDHSTKIGFNFGITSTIITILALMVGLNSGTHLRLAVIGGILIIAIADSMSDALGIHISEEGEGKHTSREIWKSTLVTFFTKFILALIFLVPILVFDLSIAIKINLILGLAILGTLSYFIAKREKAKPIKIISEHLVFATIIITIAHFLGIWVANTFG
ncbi:MAG: hypothetical protein KKF56_04850 [Nanoarchaeota archaeon]|nr:hypothetical protein [Nanoarchaeota archaeon]